MAVVVDASALVELLLGSPAARPVEDAVAADQAFAPELLDAEALSAIVGLERRGELSSSSAEKAIGHLVTAHIERVPNVALVRDAWTRRRNLSAYDAMYVSLAARLGCPLVTADRGLASSPGLGVSVTLLPASQ